MKTKGELDEAHTNRIDPNTANAVYLGKAGGEVATSADGLAPVANDLARQ